MSKFLPHSYMGCHSLSVRGRRHFICLCFFSSIYLLSCFQTEAGHYEDSNVNDVLMGLDFILNYDEHMRQVMCQ